MNVLNRHECRLVGSPAQIGALIGTLATPADRLWPHACWPAMRMDRPLNPGAHGGHGPIRYTVEHDEPGRAVRFRFTAPKGFDGMHEIRIIETETAVDSVILRHELRMDARGFACLSWPLVFRPLHDALIEDAFARARHALGMAPELRRWSPWTRLLRFALGRGRSKPQSALVRSFPSSEVSTLAGDPHRSAGFMRV